MKDFVSEAAPFRPNLTLRSRHESNERPFIAFWSRRFRRIWFNASDKIPANVLRFRDFRVCRIGLQDNPVMVTWIPAGD